MVQNTFIAEVQKLSEMAKAITRQCEVITRCNLDSTQPQFSQIRSLVTGLTDDELQQLLLPANKYLPLVRLLRSSARRVLFPKGSTPTWLERAVMLSELAGWTVDEQLLRREFRRQDKAAP